MGSKEETIFIAVRLLALLSVVVGLPHLIGAFGTLFLFTGPGSSGGVLSLWLPLAAYGGVFYVLWCKTEQVVALVLKK